MAGSRRTAVFRDVSEDPVGGAAYDKHGKPLADGTMAKAQSVDAVLLGAVGGPKYDNLDFSVKPERGLLRLRKEMDLFANLRPAQCFDALADFSSLKRDVVAGLDILIVRELTSGVYFGEPRDIHSDDNNPENEGGRVGINTQRYTSGEIRRVARAAFELARKRGATASVRWKRPTSWNRAFCGARKCNGSTTTNIPMSSCRICMPITAPCSWCATRASST